MLTPCPATRYFTLWKYHYSTFTYKIEYKGDITKTYIYVIKGMERQCNYNKKSKKNKGNAKDIYMEFELTAQSNTK